MLYSHFENYDRLVAKKVENILDIIGAFWGNRNRLSKGGEGGLELLWHLLGSKSQLINKVEIMADIVGEFWEKKYRLSVGKGVLCIYDIFSDKNHTFLSAKKVENVLIL